MEKEKSTIDKFIEPSQWMVWKFQVRVNLMASEIMDYVDGTKTKPNNEADENHVKNLAEWKKNDARAQKIMVNSCGSKVLIHLCNCKTSKEMWDKLHSVYEHTNDAAKQLLQEKYHAYKKDPAHDIATHISTLQSMVQNLTAVGVTIDDNALITKILMTLPLEYRHFLPAWDSTAASERTLINLTNRLMVEENRCGLQSLNLNEVKTSEALLARGAGASNKQYQKHQKKSGKSKQKGKCFKCGSTQHYKRDCKATVSSEKTQSTSKDEDKDKAFFGNIVEDLPRDDAWYHDTGATSHMSKRRDWFVTYNELKEPIKVTLGNGDVMLAIGRGELNILSYDGSNWIEKTMKNVLYAPGLYANLFSSTAAMDNGHTTWSDKERFKMFDGEKLVAVGARRGNMFQMLFKVIEPTVDKSMVNIASKSDQLRIWHERLGHQNLVHVRGFLKNIWQTTSFELRFA